MQPRKRLDDHSNKQSTPRCSILVRHLIDISSKRKGNKAASNTCFLESKEELCSQSLFGAQPSSAPLALRSPVLRVSFHEYEGRDMMTVK